eukprot:TRINITY_DN78715_c0_g1_i1.p1 TRINITY_DN78715_c0_g1~~TRINITY_DN78715_c0_g1_i1.p1  ORF type:complete len:715 (+),score=144.22 TRINITY_DN78715_c0_g1_i1:67-2145(+)
MSSPQFPTLLASCPSEELPDIELKSGLKELDKKDEHEEAKSLNLESYAAAWACSVEQHGDLDALIYDGVGPEVRYTYRDAESCSNRLARNLCQKYGIKAGDLIVTVMENRPELVILLLSCIKLGAVFVPLATDLKIADCHRVVAMYEPKLIVCDQSEYTPFRMQDGSERELLLVPHFRAGRNMLKTMMEEGSDEPLEVPAASHDEISIIFSTSGSTGVPKGVMHSSACIAAMGNLAKTLKSVPRQNLFELEAGGKNLLWISMRGVGATLVLLTHLIEGVTQIMVDTYPSGPQLWASLIDKHRIDYFLLFGAAMNQMLQEMPHRRFESLKEVSYGGSCFTPSLIQKSMEQFPNAHFKQGYAMTECFPVSSLGPEYHKRASEAAAEDLLRMSSAGKIIGDAVMIEDLEKPFSGQPPPEGKKGVGQVCVKAQIMMMGYFKNEEKTREVLSSEDGYYRSGDVGRLDEDGFLHILGRVKEIIPTHRGFNCSPRDLEEILYQHPKVGQAAVVGIKHPCGAGEAVVAWVTPKVGAQLSSGELRVHFEETGTPGWQMPDAIHVRYEPLPTTGGKIAKQTLQESGFRKAALAKEFSVAIRQLEVEGVSQESKESVASPGKVLFEGLSSSARGSSCSCEAVGPAELEAILGESAEIWQVRQETNGKLPEISLDDFLKLLGSMEADARAAFILEARSLLMAAS